MPRSTPPRTFTAYECDHMRPIIEAQPGEWHHITPKGGIGDVCSAGVYQVEATYEGDHTLVKSVLALELQGKRPVPPAARKTRADIEDELARTHAGRRAKINRLSPHESDGTTGRLQMGEGGLYLRLDQPHPEWADDYEDSRSGLLFFEHDVSELELVDENFPIHSGTELPSGKS